MRQRNGKESFRETVVVDEAELNTAVPDGVFTLAGLNLDFGQPVGLPDLKNPQDQPSWGKNGLDWENTSQKASIMAYNQKMQQQVASTPPPTPDVPQTSYRWLYYAGAGVLAALAAGIAVVLVRRHRARPT